MVRTVGEDEEGGEASHSIVTPEHLHSCTLGTDGTQMRLL